MRKKPVISPNASESPSESPSLLPPADWHYEQSVEQIEQMIQRIEVGELPLADVFSEFEAAVAELRRCETFLMQHQAQVDLLIETLMDPDG
jgi:exodeoxyribonuclease VII small subunit